MFCIFTSCIFMSCVFLSCIFMSRDFDGPSFSRPKPERPRKIQRCGWARYPTYSTPTGRFTSDHLTRRTRASDEQRGWTKYKKHTQLWSHSSLDSFSQISHLNNKTYINEFMSSIVGHKSLCSCCLDTIGFAGLFVSNCGGTWSAMPVGMNLRCDAMRQPVKIILPTMTQC